MQTDDPSHTSTPCPMKNFEITLVADPEAIRKLTGKDPMPSWLIGEKIAEAIHKGITRIRLNAHEAFLQYHV